MLHLLFLIILSLFYVVLSFNLSCLAILGLHFIYLLPAGSLYTVSGLLQVFAYVDLLFILLIDVIASFLIPLIWCLKFPFTETLVMYSFFSFKLGLSDLVLFKPDFVHLVLVILVFHHFLPLRQLYEVLHAHLHLVLDLHHSQFLILFLHPHGQLLISLR